MKSSTWLPPSACWSCFYLLQNLPVTQLFIRHLKYRAGWKHKLHIKVIYFYLHSMKGKHKRLPGGWTRTPAFSFLTGHGYQLTACKVSFCILICVFLKADTPPSILSISLRSYSREHGLLEHDFSKGSPAPVYNHRSATLLQLSLPLADEHSLIQQMLPECPSEMEQEQL